MAVRKPQKSLALIATRKVRSDAVLKNLPEAKQDKIVHYAETHSLSKTAAWLKRSGTTIGARSLGTFLCEYRLSQQFERHAAVVELGVADLLKRSPNITPEQVHEYGQSFFNRLAIEKQDPRIWNIIQQIELKKGKLQLEWQRYLDEANERRAKLKKDIKAAKRGARIGPDTLEQIEQELKLM